MNGCEVLIVGGGPAGLSAALVLARSGRRVTVCDAGRPRNAAAHAAHGFLTRDGIPPLELLALGRNEALSYGVELLEATVTELTATGPGFHASLDEGGPIEAKIVLLASGLVDRIPALQGIQDLYGISIHHCPYCDGWAWRHRPLAVYGRSHRGAELAHTLLGWSREIVLLTHGPARLESEARRQLERRGVRIEERRIVRLEGENGLLRHVVFAEGEPLAREALFFSIGHQQSCRLADRLGCRFTPRGSIVIDRRQRTTVPGLFAAGDATRDTQFTVIAAAAGARAAVEINRTLLEEERARELGEQAPARAVSGADTDVQESS